MDEGRGAGMGPSTHPCPQGAGACMPCGQASRSGGEPLCTRGLSQKRQAARRPGRRSAVKCCISHKGGLQWALLREIRETGNAEPPFNTHLILMELQQRQPLCGERSRSTEREQRFPNGLELGSVYTWSTEQHSTQATQRVLGPAAGETTWASILALCPVE